MSTIRIQYGTANQTITITLTSLANAAAREATALDFSSLKPLDVLIQFKTKTGAGSASTGYLNVYAAGSADGGTTYGDNVAGTGDDVVTLVAPPNITPIGRLSVPAASTAYKSRAFSLAAAFGGVIPDHVVIVIENQSGAALNATGSDHGVWYQVIKAESV